MAGVRENIAALERKTGKRFGGGKSPLLVSVRSGSAMSMPGMMDTILNLGLNDETLQGVIRETANPRFAYDSYRRFIQLFGKIALGVPDEKFDRAMAATEGPARRRAGRRSLRGGAAGARGAASSTSAASTRGRRFQPIPICSSSSRSRRCSARGWASAPSTTGASSGSRKDMANGTAVNVCTMVFGNMGDDSATGVGFTRNPAHRRERHLRRVPGERAGRGRRRRHPHAEADRGDGARRCRLSIASSSNCATGSRRTTARCRTSSSPSSAAGSIACRPAMAR